MTPQELFKPSAQPLKPHGYQKKAAKFLLEHAGAALLLDPGLGKTAITLMALIMLIKQKVVKKVLIIAPLRVCHNVWPAEVEKWADFKGLRVVVLHGPDKDKLLKQDADIYIINFEGLEWLLDIEKTKMQSGRTKVTLDLRRWQKLGFDTLVVDELSKLKNPATVRFKALKHVLPTFRRRWGLTGSPAANSLMDLFGQMYVLDEGNALGRFITNYRMNYFELGHDGFTWKLRKDADKAIYEKIAPLALRMAAEDHLDLPDLVEQDIVIDLPPKARKLYLKMEDDLIFQVNKKTVVAANAAAASTKCRQIASGGVYIDVEVDELLDFPDGKGKREVLHLHNEKIDALEDLVDEMQGKPLLVAYDFQHDLERVRARFGKDVPVLGGGTTTKEANELVKAWNLGKLPLFFVHPQSAGHGLNLQGGGASHLVWLSLTWNYELYTQTIARLWRQGTTSQRIFVHRILARDTVDVLVAKTLRFKEKGQQALFDALKELRATRGTRSR